MMSNKFDKFKIRGIENPKKANMMFYYIITDAEKTEKYFFEGLKKSLPKEKQDRLCIKVVQNQTNKLIEKALELQQEPGNKRKIIIVFDRDQVKNFDKIIDKAKKTGFIEVAWSNPCFEIFFMGYFGSVSKAQNSTQTISEFNKMYYESTNKKYKKNDEKILYNLRQFGSESEAIRRSKERLQSRQCGETIKPSQLIGCTTVGKILEEFNNIADNL